LKAAGESGLDWRQTVTHRELGLDGQGASRPDVKSDSVGASTAPVQAQEA
jgi:hypothetical protein